MENVESLGGLCPPVDPPLGIRCAEIRVGTSLKRVSSSYHMRRQTRTERKTNLMLYVNESVAQYRSIPIKGPHIQSASKKV